MLGIIQWASGGPDHRGPSRSARLTFLLETIRLGLSNLRLHMLRAVLTALGIILGVSAVITMVSIGEGRKRDALLQIERLGAKNIIVRSLQPPEPDSSSGQERSWVSKYGITRADLEVIRENFPEAESIVPLKELGSEIIRGGRKRVSQAYGTTPEILTSSGIRVARGRYLTQSDMDNRSMVCVIGDQVAKDFFPLDDPLGSEIRIDSKTFRVIGVLSPVGLAAGAGTNLVGRDLNKDLHVPLTTATATFGDVVARRTSGSFSGRDVQIAEVHLTSPDRDRVIVDAERLKRIMEVRHPGLKDVQFVVPYELLEEAKRSLLVWNMVLGAIASISLLVGGIGIMNIMLATVTERTREIGIRRALGATRKHIVGQFLVETGVLSCIGGLVGVVLGLAISWGIGYGVPLLPRLPLVGRYVPTNVSLPTQVTGWSIALAFLVAALTGLVFGLYPALKASRQDPIQALRHD